MDGKRYARGLWVWIGIYAVLLYASIALLDHNIISWLPARVVVALVPMIAGCGILVHTMREYRAIDELQKKIVAEGIMFGFGATALITFSYGFLQRFVGAPDVSYFAVWAVMGATWAIGGYIARYRYR